MLFFVVSFDVWCTELFENSNTMYLSVGLHDSVSRYSIRIETLNICTPLLSAFHEDGTNAPAFQATRNNVPPSQ